MTDNTQDPAPGYTPRKIIQQSNLGDIGATLPPPPPPVFHKRNKWARK